MKNLTDHVCFRCQHLNRHQRTTHGHYGDYIRARQQELDENLRKRNFDMVRYLKQDIDKTFEQMVYFERYASHRDYSRYAEMNRRDSGKRFCKLVLY